MGVSFFALLAQALLGKGIESEAVGGSVGRESDSATGLGT